MKRNRRAGYTLVERSLLPMRWLQNLKSPSLRHEGEGNYLFADGPVKTYLPKGAFEIETAPIAP